MMLWDYPVSHKNDNLHSIKSGETHHKSGKAATNRQRILTCLTDRGADCPDNALTHRRIAEITGMDYHEVSRRSSELGRSGRCERIVDDGPIKLFQKSLDIGKGM